MGVVGARGRHSFRSVRRLAGTAARNAACTPDAVARDVARRVANGLPQSNRAIVFVIAGMGFVGARGRHSFRSARRLEGAQPREMPRHWLIVVDRLNADLVHCKPDICGDGKVGPVRLRPSVCQTVDHSPGGGIHCELGMYVARAAL
jgi:hypothetical protein